MLPVADARPAQLPAAYAVPSGDDSPLAQRTFSEPPHPYRSPFQRDRDRVLHTRAFRRLAGKTQVFTRRSSDHFRSRLTHTLEVTQIARTIASVLGLNEDLTETLALVHDIGHPPFGHAGEKVLDQLLREHGLRFDHNLHALRIVSHFERRYAGFRGLNLTFAVREGIIKHSRDYTAAEHPQLSEYLLDQRPPLEAQIIDLADEIAYLTADLDDGIESGILDLETVRARFPLFEQHFVAMQEEHPGAWQRLVFNEAIKRTLNSLVDDLISATRSKIAASGVENLADVRDYPQRLCTFSPEGEVNRHQAKDFLFEFLYSSEDLYAEKTQAVDVMGGLFQYWMSSPEELPTDQRAQIPEEGLPRVVADYLAGMTDPFIVEQYRRRIAGG